MFYTIDTRSKVQHEYAPVPSIFVLLLDITNNIFLHRTIRICQLPKKTSSLMINYNSSCSRQLCTLVTMTTYKESGKMCHGEDACRIIKHESSLGAYSNVISGM